jgi:hypothetical protein
VKRQRSFLFTGSSEGWARVLCRWCGWKRQSRRRDPQLVYGLAEMHECDGTETVAEMEARLALEGGR